MAGGTDKKPGSWLGNVGGSANWVALFFPVHLCELFISITFASPCEGVDGGGWGAVLGGHFGELSSDGTIFRGDR